jgi:membrane protease YdiL (CAAX protease family)
MRDIFRPEALWREVIPIGIFALIVLFIFLIAFFNTEDLAGAQGALLWTMNAVGALLAVLATFGLFWRALQGDPLELQFGFVLALLAGLLLVNVHWSLAIALGVIGVSLIAREIWGGWPGSRYSPPSDRPLP